MWEFITNHIFIIILVALVSVIIVYIFLKQDSSKKKIVQKQEKTKEESKKEVIKESAINKEDNVKTIITKQEPQKIIDQEIKQEVSILNNTQVPRGERQESLNNFKNERLKSHVSKLKPAVQAVILKK